MSEPLEDSVSELIKNGELYPGRIKKRDENMVKKLRDIGIENDEIRIKKRNRRKRNFIFS